VISDLHVDRQHVKRRDWLRLCELVARSNCPILSRVSGTALTLRLRLRVSSCLLLFAHAKTRLLRAFESRLEHAAGARASCSSCAFHVSYNSPENNRTTSLLHDFNYSHLCRVAEHACPTGLTSATDILSLRRAVHLIHRPLSRRSFSWSTYSLRSDHGYLSESTPRDVEIL